MAPNDVRTNSDISTDSVQKTGIPRIPLNLRDHKKAIAIPFTVLVFFSGFLPILLYWVLAKAAKTSATVYVTVPTVIFGANTLPTLITRTWRLARKDSTVRPIGASRWSFDYFHINFAFLFVALTVMISVGSSLAGKDIDNDKKKAVRIVSMSLPIIMISTCAQLAFVFVIMSVAPLTRSPLRISSVAPGDIVRPGSYSIAEDIVAVDAKQGVQYRHQLSARYEFSEDVRAVFLWADAVWGFSGVALGAGLIAVIWAVENPGIGYTCAWGVPWVWAAVLAWATIQRTKSACRTENSRYATA